MVTEVGRGWRGAVELRVAIRGDGEGEGGGRTRALAYPELVGEPRVGDRVLLNVNALALGLGTGGYALVVALPDRLPPDQDGPGHMVKARYSPLQPVVAGVDEQDSPHHPVLAEADDVAGMPVVVADLHSALPAICAAVLADRPGTRICYLMGDGGALPLWFSRTVAGLRAAGWLVGSVTVGQSFGGEVEAVSTHSGLLAARHVLAAEVTVVAQGPGNLGGGTRWGFSGVACGEAVNAAATLGGRPVASLRISDADPRERHHGVSHHSLTAYGRVALARADVVAPRLDGPLGARVREQLRPLAARHRLVEVDVADLGPALADTPTPLSTMGRGLAQDAAYFLAAAAAGRHAARLLADD